MIFLHNNLKFLNKFGTKNSLCKKETIFSLSIFIFYYMENSCYPIYFFIYLFLLMMQAF